MEQQQIVLELKAISKEFPGVKALNDVSLTLYQGEVLGLVGENGAGKSTLVKIINGVYTRDAGDILINGKVVEMNNPAEAIMVHKIAYVSQENTLCPDLTVAENIVLGQWTGGAAINWKQIYDFAQKALDALGLKVKPTDILADISPADRQLVEIARAVSQDSKILLLDEPTSWLTESEKKYLFDRIKHLKTNQDVGIIFISHFLDEVLKICDRIQVMREGISVGVFPAEELTKEMLIEQMLGQKKREIMYDENIADRVKEKVVLEVRGLTQEGMVDNVSFELHEGEILGITGLLGCGKTEIGRMISGSQIVDGGQILVDGEEQKKLTSKKCAKLGIGYISKDRKEEGIIPFLSITKNITLASLKSALGKFKHLSLHKEKEIAKKMIEVLDVRPRDPEREIIYLSGGNQQKAIIAKWIQADSKILVIDEPTRGIDIGAKFEIYNLLREQAKGGKAVVFISSELTEVLEVTDRFLVLRSGKVTGEYTHYEIKDEHGLLAILSV